MHAIKALLRSRKRRRRSAETRSSETVRSTLDASTAGKALALARGDRERFIAAGFDGYLSKPVDIDELLETIRRYCDGGDE